MLDTHAHLAAPEFRGDLDRVLERARGAGVTGVVSVAETLEDARENLALAARYPGYVHAAAGLYPTHLEPAEAERMEAFIRAERPRLVAIGEVGLDRWQVRDATGREVQEALFARFVDLSKELDLPLSVHSRSAGRHAVALLLARGARRAILHAFDGRASAALPAVEAGYFFSVPPSVVRSRQKQKLVRHLPLTSLLLESDSPVLGPDPGGRNEPANLPVALRAIAELRGEPVHAVREQIRENARRLFGDSLDAPP